MEVVEMISTKYRKLENNNEEKILKEAAEAIKRGKLVIFPTETVYGIGTNALDEEAVKNIFIAKGRASDNPLIVHIAEKEELKELVEEPNLIEKQLIKAFFPGPFTIVLKKKQRIPGVVTASLDTVCIRMPNNNIARNLIRLAGVPIAAPSANQSGSPSGTKIEDIFKEFNGKVEYILDKGMVEIGLESTVVRVIEDKVHILRPGKITPEDIEELGLKVEIDPAILQKNDSNQEILSPGMKYRHYAPNTKCVMVHSTNQERMINKINELSKDHNVLVIGKSENLERYIAKYKLDMGNSVEEIAHNMFSLLRKADEYKVEQIIIEGVERTGLGLAINNRLLRACEYHDIEC